MTLKHLWVINNTFQMPLHDLGAKILIFSCKRFFDISLYPIESRQNMKSHKILQSEFQR